MSDDDVLEAEVVDTGASLSRTVLTRIALCLKVATLHRLDNAAMVGPVANLLEAVTQPLKAGERLAVQVLGDNCYVNKELVRLDFSSIESANALKGIFKRLGVHELAFTALVNEAEVRQLLGVFQTHYLSKDPTAIVRFPLPKAAFRQITPAEADALGAAAGGRPAVTRGLAVLALAISQQLDAMHAGKSGRRARVRRAIHALADASAGNETLVVELSRFDAFSGEQHLHLTAVTALTLLVARRLGMPRPELAEVCLAAAFHDVGEPGGQGGDAERGPLRTALATCAVGLNPDVLERLATAWELTCFAPVGSPVSFGQVVAVPAAFDALVSPPPPKQGLTPEAALAQVLDEAGTRFDERVVQVFAGIVAGSQEQPGALALGLTSDASRFDA